MLQLNLSSTFANYIAFDKSEKLRIMRRQFSFDNKQRHIDT